MNIPQRAYLKVRRESKYLQKDIRHLFGLDESFLKNARGSRILIYHGICQHDHTRFNPIFLKLKTFEQHLQLYQQYFNVVSLDDFYQQRFSSNKFNITITFDDGYANNHKYVLPLLNKYHVQATFFITAIREAGYDILWNDFLGILGKYGPAKLFYKNEEFYKGLHNKYISQKTALSLTETLRSGNFDVKAEMMEQLTPLVPFRKNKLVNEDYWLQMTQEQIRNLSVSPYATIGSHGYYHNDLARISANDTAQEMTRSKEYLEGIIDRPVNSFAFPYGTYTHETVEKAKSAGYNQLLAMDFHFGDDHADVQLKERFTVNPFISPINQMHATITKSYER